MQSYCCVSFRQVINSELEFLFDKAWKPSSLLACCSCDITSHSLEVTGTTVLLERLESAIWWLRYSRLTGKVQFCSVDRYMAATFTFLPHL